MKVVLQDGIKDCGICCLLSIIRFYGGEVSKEYLRKLTNTNKDGVSAYNLIEAAKSLGMDAYGMSGELKKMDINNLPCIAHVNVNASYQHFVVLYKIEAKKVIIMDPAVGKKALNISEFLLMSTNNYIILKAKKRLPIFNSKKIVRKVIFSGIKRNIFKIILLILLMFNLIILEVLIAFNFKYMITFSINYLVSTNIRIISILIILLNLFYICMYILYRKLLYKLIFLFDKEITIKTFKQLIFLPYFYYKNRTVGEVLSRFNDLTTIKGYLVKFFSSFLNEFISLIVFFSFIVSINSRMACFVLSYFLICSIFVFKRSFNKKKLFKQTKKIGDRVESYIVESLTNVDTTKGSHLEKRFFDKFRIKYNQLLEKNYKYFNIINFNSAFFKAIENILNVLIYGIGSYYVISNKLDLENLIIFITFFQYVLKCFNILISNLEELPNFNICIERVEDLYSIFDECFIHSYFYLNYKLDGDIHFNKLYYKVDNRIIFNGIDLLLKSGDRVLLFGNSGSGKSTLVKMLLRYVEIPFSMISIGGIDINHYHLENLRKYITYVSSNELLFNDTIYNNICLYKDISEDVFMKIIKICRVNKIFGNDIRNYKRIIEENGFLLSSGERQRIILARSLARMSNIYIFDEAFGQIDIEQTNKIISDMFDYLKGKTIIVISHRNNNKKYFNRVLKLSDGIICEK